MIEATPEDRALVASALARKDDSGSVAPAELEAELAATAAMRAGPAAEPAVRAAAAHLSMRLRSAGASDPDGYLRHAYRVARITLDWDAAPAAETVALAVLHNVAEVGGAEDGGLAAAGFSDRVISGVRALTIDRSRHEDEPYLAGFYAAIERAGRHVALVRCADKIDNLLGYDASGEDARRARYADLTETFVLPMARRLSPRLGRFLAAVIEHARAGGVARPA